MTILEYILRKTARHAFYDIRQIHSGVETPGPWISFRLYISGFRYFTSRDDDMDDLYMFYITGYFGLVRRSGSGVGPPAPELCKWN
jgi:hypothetical protein